MALPRNARRYCAARTLQVYQKRDRLKPQYHLVKSQPKQKSTPSIFQRKGGGFFVVRLFVRNHYGIIVTSVKSVIAFMGRIKRNLWNMSELRITMF